MFLRFEAQLNGNKFSDIAPELILRDIVESPAEVDVSKVRYANRPGQRVSSIVRTSLSVRLVYVIRSQDIQRRMEIRDLIAAWAANGGTLKVNTRPGKMLRVICETSPMLESSLRWTQDLSLTLTAYSIPYWQDEAATNLPVISAVPEKGGHYFADVFLLPGQCDAMVSAMIINAGTDTMTTLSIQCDKTKIKLEGMSIPAGHVVLISYENDVLSILDFTDVASEDNSLLRYRTADSSDDLVAKVKRGNQIIIEADQSFQGKVFAQGVWL